jgi:hypothetical protein
MMKKTSCNPFKDGSKLSEDVIAGGQILKIAIDFDTTLHKGANCGQALQQLKESEALYNPEILRLLAGLRLEAEEEKILSVDSCRF